MKVLQSLVDSKKDMVQAGNAVTALNSMVGAEVKMVGYIIYEQEKEDGKIQKVCAIKRDNGEFLTSISDTVRRSVEAIAEVYEEDEIRAGLVIAVRSKQSIAGRDFLYIDLV